MGAIWRHGARLCQAMESLPSALPSLCLSLTIIYEVHNFFFLLSERLIDAYVKHPGAEAIRFLLQNVFPSMKNFRLSYPTVLALTGVTVTSV